MSECLSFADLSCWGRQVASYQRKRIAELAIRLNRTGL